jgi:hypothetical protein
VKTFVIAGKMYEMHVTMLVAETGERMYGTNVKMFVIVAKMVGTGKKTFSDRRENRRDNEH